MLNKAESIINLAISGTLLFIISFRLYINGEINFVNIKVANPQIKEFKIVILPFKLYLLSE